MASKITRVAVAALLLLISFSAAKAQHFTYTSGALNVDVFVSNPCGGGPSNGYLQFKINSAATSSVLLQVLGVGPAAAYSQFAQIAIPVGGTYIHNPGKTLIAGTYHLLIADTNTGGDFINTFSSNDPAILTALPAITVVDNGTNLTNTSCSNPDGKIAFDITGGSKALAGGGSYQYTITSTNGVVGFPLTGTTNGNSTLNVVSLLNATNPPISGLPGGTYTLTLTDDYSSCGATKAWTITDPSPAVFNTVVATPAVCLGQPGTVQLSNSEGSAVTYEIFKNGVATGVTLTGTNGLLNFTIPASLLSPVGTYTFTIKASNGFCTPLFMNGSAVITVNPLPVPTITGTSSLCEGTAGVVYTTESGKAAYSWSVTGGVITAGVGTNAITVTWTTPGGQNISVNYQDANGCSAAIPTIKLITVNPNPVPTITGPASSCINATGVAYNTETGKTAYVWSIVGGTITSGAGTSSIQVTWTSMGPQSVSVNYTDANGCTGNAPTTKAVTVNPLPVPTISGPASACLNSSTTYTTEIGNSGYSWTVSAGGTITSGALTNSIVVNWSTTGPKTVTVSYTDPNGCAPAAPTTIPVNVNPLPVPTITGPSAACAGTTGFVYSTQVANTGYTWVISSGGIITAGAGTSSITVTWITAGAQTVSVNYTDVNGCTAPVPAVENVTVNPLPVPVITGNNLVCQGATGVSYSTAPGNTSYVWNVTGGIVATGLGTNTITVNWTTAGSQSVSVNYTDVNGCTATAPTVLPVTVNTLPTPTITGSNNVCVGSTTNTYTTESGNTAYTWNITGGTISAGGTTNVVTVTWSTTGPQSISVNYTNVNGCTAAAPTVLPVTVNALPVPTITGPASVCVNATGVVYFTETGKTGYLWSITGGTITSGAGTNSITVDWSAAGAQSVSVNYTDVNGCAAASPVIKPVTVNPLPVPVITGSTSVCTGSTGNTYSTTAGNTAYIWTVSAGGVITSGAGTNIISVTWNAAGPQSVTVNYTDVNGCAAASPTTKPVTVNPLPVPTITGPLSVCSGSTSNVYLTENGNSAYVWTVTGGTITSGAGTNSVTITWTTTGSESISVSYTDVNGCTAVTPTVQAVTVNPQPVPTITGTTSVCIGTSGVPYSTEPGKTSYLWNVTGGNITSGAGTNAITVDWTLAGPQTVSVNYTDASGCSAATPTTKGVTVNPLPVPTITGNGTACLNSTGNAYLTESGNSGYVWTVSAGGTITAGAGTNAITVTWNGSGAQSVSVTYTDVNGCSPVSPVSKTVIINNLPIPTITGPATVCSGATGVTYATETTATGYLWTISGGTITAGAGTSAITVTWPAAGSGNVSVTYTDANGCTPVAPTVQPVTINNTPNATINPAGPFCSNAAAVTLTAVTPGGVWSGLGITNTTTGTFDPSVAGPGTAVVSYTLNTGGCSDTKTLGIVVNPAPDATITSTGPFCITDPPSNLTAVTPGGTWSGPGITNSVAGTFSPASAGIGTFTITYSVVSAAGCTDTKTASITVGNPPDATITPVGPFCSNDPVVTLTAATAGGTWTGSGITNAVSGTFDPSVASIGSNTITYTVIIGGCSDTKNITIQVTKAPDATITPAGPFCILDPPATLTAATPGGTWSGTAVNAATGVFDPAAAGVGTFLITYSVTVSGCTDTKSISVTVANPPNATITPAGPFCSNDLPVNFTATTSGGVWSGTGVTDTALGTFDPAVAGPGTFTITYSITIGGCSDTKTAAIKVNTAPNATIAPAGPFCTSDAPVTLSAATTGGTWSGTSVNPTTGVFTPSSAGAGTFVISYTVSPGGCSDTKTVSIVVSSPPDATINPAGPFTKTDPPVNLTAATPGGVWSGPGITNTTAGTFTPSVAGVGIFTITYKVTVGGCTDTKSIQIQVTGVGSNCTVFNATVTDILPSCNGQNNGTITIDLTASTLSTPPYIIQLSGPSGFAQGLTGSGPVFQFVNLAPDDYLYTMLDAAGNTCTLPYTLKREIGIVAMGSNFTDAKCFDGDGAATITVVSGGTSPFEYSIDAGATWVTFTSPVTITNLGASLTPYSVLVRDDAADVCQTEVLVSINGPGAALDTLYVNRTVSLPDLSTGTLLVGIQESGNEDYEVRLELITPLFAGQTYVKDWTLVTRNPENLKFETKFTGLYAGDYKLSIRDGVGCEKDYVVKVGVDTNIFIPNVFTPNDDGSNDKFYIRNLPEQTIVVITNRWGKEVFSSSAYDNQWDGSGIADGIYFYRIKADGKVFTGWLEIIRGQ